MLCYFVVRRSDTASCYVRKSVFVCRQKNSVSVRTVFLFQLHFSLIFSWGPSTADLLRHHYYHRHVAEVCSYSSLDSFTCAAYFTISARGKWMLGADRRLHRSCQFLRHIRIAGTLLGHCVPRTSLLRPLVSLVEQSKETKVEWHSSRVLF